ncbi:unnamed protein product [Paramecium sonneborni]|uniref:Palmitoyltransferase n=1 Tax=Paramecium sonneborni TaxID=65129 RepID=A0A8S1PMB8_9CILI|nr:unnamed protein product [Paramecium sonneborni]
MLHIKQPQTQKSKRVSKMNQFSKQAGPFIIFFTILMPTNCVILEQYYFDLKLDNVSQNIQNFMIYFVYMMAMWSYYQAITIKNTTPQRAPLPPDNRRIDPIYKNNAACASCNKWKPIRAHHCSMCNQCTLKMDHHCPWIHNCVGLRNHRAFYLFTLYMTIGAIQYSWASYVYFKDLYRNDKGFFQQQSSFFYFYWFFTSLVLYPTCAMLFFLFLYHTLLVLTNLTTLEQMKNGSNIICCCQNPTSKSINLFNRGWIANVAWFFNYSYLWFLPFQNIYETDGTSYPIAPLCTFADIETFDLSMGDGISPNTQIDLEQFDPKFLDYIATAKEKYKGKKVILNGKEIVLA